MATQAELVTPEATRLWHAQGRWLKELQKLEALVQAQKPASMVASYMWTLADKAARFEVAAEAKE